MVTTEVPYERLLQLREALGLHPEDLDLLARYRDVFAGEKQEFAARFHRAFLAFPETRMLLEHEERPRFLRRAWAHWFETLFGTDADREFLAYLWTIGTRHVEVNLDQRFSNLGFSVARQFCQEILASSVPREDHHRVGQAVDKLLDLCLLVETAAYIETTTSCDLEVIKGVADRVRTPATVIGGNLKRLSRRVSPGSPDLPVYEALLLENGRLERMVTDIETYSALIEREPEFLRCSLERLLPEALAGLEPEDRRSRLELNVAIDPEAGEVEGDPRELGQLFRALLQNALDAADRDRPRVSISATAVPDMARNVRITIFNNGAWPTEEDLDQLFSPFYSTKPLGTGFGLPIAQLIVRKHFGRLRLVPVPGEGTRVEVTLPAWQVRRGPPEAP